MHQQLVLLKATISPLEVSEAKDVAVPAKDYEEDQFRHNLS